MTFVAIWNCTRSKTWSDRPFLKRIYALRNAVALAAGEAEGGVALGMPWIFAAPEYAFSHEDDGSGKPAVQVRTALERRFRGDALALSGRYPQMVFAPGTIAVADGERGERAARNTSYGFFNGAQQWRVDKRRDVGEISNQDRFSRLLIFRSGTGFARVQIAGVWYGIEICADACYPGTLPIDVDRHLILASGASVESIRDRSTELQIVADVGGYGVWFKQDGDRNQVYPYDSAETDGTDIHYFDA